VEALRDNVVFYEDSILSRWQVDYLLASGISPGMENDQGLTAYGIVIVAENYKLIKYLPNFMSKTECELALSEILSRRGTKTDIINSAVDALRSRIEDFKVENRS